MFRCKFHNCNQTFREAHQFGLHKAKHLKKKDVKCTICQQKCYDKVKLAMHMYAFHNFECLVCHVKYPNRGIFMTHMQTHPDAKMLECESCDHKDWTASGMRKHVDFNHSGDLKKSCDHCDERFATNRQKYAHMLALHDD